MAGTAHVHLLVVWLEDGKCCYTDINAHIPYDDEELAFLVYDLQQSHKTVLPCNEHATQASTDQNGKQHLSYIIRKVLLP